MAKRKIPTARQLLRDNTKALAALVRRGVKAKFDQWEADQPTRNYHDPLSALAEAEAIAAVLLADRMERGSIKGWTRP